MQTYSNASNARRAVKTYTAKLENVLVSSEVLPVDGKFAVSFVVTREINKDLFNEINEKFSVSFPRIIINRVKRDRRTIAKLDETPVVGDFTYCPVCDVHLSNGVLDYVNAKMASEDSGNKDLAIEKEYLCLGCNEEFGEIVNDAKVIKVGNDVLVKGRGIKIQKEREERNGIKRPSAGGKCDQLWNLFEKHYNETGLILTPKPAKALSAVEGLDPVTTTVQLYKWREFMGFGKK